MTSNNIGSDLDRISSLPDGIREHILTFIPLREAARASILSTTWRNTWLNLPTLTFDETFETTTMLDLFRVLMLHRGPLKGFRLPSSVPEEHIDKIMSFLGDKPVESLTITTQGYEFYSLSSFSRHMKSLRLSGCRYPTSSSGGVSFEEFRVLTVLELRNVKLMDEDDSSWSFRCPLLSVLTLDGFGRLYQRPSILIEAPRLEYCSFVGNFCCLTLKNTQCLKKAILHKEPTHLVDKKADSILKLWDGLAAVESLSVSGHFCRYLAPPRNGRAMLRLLKPWEMLRHLTFHDICLSRYDHSWSLLQILRSSPNLQRLIIQITRAVDPSLRSRLDGSAIDVGTLQRWIEGKGTSLYVLRRLKRVEVKNLKGTRHEITWIQWLLKSSPALDEMEITLSATLSAVENISILKELNGIRRPSAIARMIIN